MRSKLLLLVLCAALASLTLEARAQSAELTNAYDTQYGVYKPSEGGYNSEELPWHNDIRLGIGVPGPIHILVVGGIDTDIDPDFSTTTASDNLAEARYYDTASIYLPPLTLEYSRYLKEWFMIGCKVMYSSIYYHERHIATHKRLTTHYDNTLGIHLNMRFEYLRREICRMYSGIGVGATLRYSKEAIVGIPMLDMTYVGMTVGKRLYGFAELGAGISGCIRVGMGCKF
ncbi:MAG: hypothetical protein J6V26_01440 [Alistipes sp.]|nr:hypothetical protein [Alistipes sp.]